MDVTGVVGRSGEGSSLFGAVEFLVQFGVIEAKLRGFVVDLGVVDAGVHHIEDRLHHLRAGGLDELEHLLVADEVGERDQQFSRLTSHFLVRVIDVGEYPGHCFAVGEVLLTVPFEQRPHQLQFGDDELGVVLHLDLVAKQLAGDAGQSQEGDVGQFEVGAVGEFLHLPVGVVEEVEQLSEDLLDEEGHVLEGKADLEVGQLVDQVDHLQRQGRLLRTHHPRQQLERPHELLLRLHRPHPLPHKTQRLLLAPPVATLRQLPHPLRDEPEVRLHPQPQLRLQRHQLDLGI